MPRERAFQSSRGDTGRECSALHREAVASSPCRGMSSPSPSPGVCSPGGEASVASAEGGGTSSSRLRAWHQPAASQHLRGSPVAFVHSLLCDRCDSHAVEDSMTSHVLCGPAACHQGTRPKDRRTGLAPASAGAVSHSPRRRSGRRGRGPPFLEELGARASHVLLKKKTAGVSARCQPIRGWSDLRNKNGRIWSKRAHTGTIATMAMRWQQRRSRSPAVPRCQARASTCVLHPTVS